MKAFNTIGNPYFVDPSFSEGQPTMLIAGDDQEAKDTVRNVLTDFGWSDTVDIGGIEGSRELEAICIVWVKIGAARGAASTGSGRLPVSDMGKQLKLALNTGYWAGGPPAGAAERIADAERLGFDSVWCSEAWLGRADPLAWWGSRTERVRLGTRSCS